MGLGTGSAASNPDFPRSREHTAERCYSPALTSNEESIAELTATLRGTWPVHPRVSVPERKRWLGERTGFEILEGSPAPETGSLGVRAPRAWLQISRVTKGPTPRAQDVRDFEGHVRSSIQGRGHARAQTS